MAWFYFLFLIVGEPKEGCPPNLSRKNNTGPTNLPASARAPNSHKQQELLVREATLRTRISHTPLHTSLELEVPRHI